MKRTSLLITIVLLTFSPGFSQKDKLTAEEVVARHLASIGTPGDIAAVKSRIMTGEGKIAFTPTGVEFAKGAAQLASTDNKLIFAMIFDKNEYPYEKAAFDGKEQTYGMYNGIRTPLGNFLKSQDAVLKEGLFGGALSSAWPLLDLKGRNAELKYAGIAELGGRQAHKLKYTSRTGDLQISLYFDPDNFHHIRTEYKYSIDARMGRSAEISSTSKPTYFTLMEDFGDFKRSGNLTLPMTYKINIERTAQNAPLVAVGGVSSASVYLTIKIIGVIYNEALDPAAFKVS